MVWHVGGGTGLGYSVLQKTNWLKQPIFFWTSEAIQCYVYVKSTIPICVRMYPVSPVEDNLILLLLTVIKHFVLPL